MNPSFPFSQPVLTMFSSLNLLIFTGLMLGRDVLCLPQYTNVGSVDPPTVTTLMIREQSELLLSTITCESREHLFHPHFGTVDTSS